MDIVTTIERVTKELAELQDRLTKLKNYIDCPFFRELPDMDKDLLRTQRVHMEALATVLDARLICLKDQLKNQTTVKLNTQGGIPEQSVRFIASAKPIYGNQSTIPARFRTTGLSFAEALEFAYAGHKIARAGWNGTNMYAWIAPEFKTITTHGESLTHRNYWQLKCADTSVATWSPSGSDTLAHDWYVVSP